MKLKHLVGLGILLALLGMGGRLLPRASEGLSVFSVLQAIGILLLVILIVRNWSRIRIWVKSHPSGGNVRFLCAFLLLLAVLQCVWSISRELEREDIFAPIERDVTSDDPDAALALSSDLSEDRVADTKRELNTAWRIRILERLAELKRPSHSAYEVVEEIYWRLRNGPDDSVKDAAVAALAAQIGPEDLLRLISEMSDLDGPGRRRLGRSLERKTGLTFGDDADRWVEWFSTTWGGVGDAEAFDLAERAWRQFADRPAARELAIARIAEGSGADAKKLAALLEDDDPALRAAAAEAARRRHQKELLPQLGRQIKKETDPRAADAMARALVDIGPPESVVRLLDAVRTGVGEAGVREGERILAAYLELSPGVDPMKYVEGLYRKLAHGVKERGELFRELLRSAGESAPARAALAGVAGRVSAPDGERVDALSKVLEVEPALLSDAVLTRIAKERPDTDLSRMAQKELDRR